MTADEELRRALEELMETPPTGNQHYNMGWFAGVEAARAALAARSDITQAATGGPDFTPKEWPEARSEPRAYEPLSGLDALRHDIEAEPRAEGLREALQAIIDLRTVVPDHPHGGVHPPYLEWLKVADIARRALAATPPAEGLHVDRLARALTANWTLVRRKAYTDGGTPLNIARAIAREYAALSPEQPE